MSPETYEESGFGLNLDLLTILHLLTMFHILQQVQQNDLKKSATINCSRNYSSMTFGSQILASTTHYLPLFLRKLSLLTGDIIGAKHVNGIISS